MKLLIFILFTSLSWAQDNVPEKKHLCTEEEFEKESNKRALQKLKKFKKGDIVEFSKQLMNRQNALKMRSLELEKESEQIKITSQELEKKIQEFSKRQQEFIGCVDDMEKRKGKRITHLVEIMANMRPAVAADILSVQEADISVEILGHLPAEKVSKMFNSMDKEISARLQKQYMNMKK